jgi:hypothetical protein
MSSILYKILHKISKTSRSLAKNMTAEDRAWNNQLKKWAEENRKRDLRLDYPELSSDSIVIDLGGYKGQWTSDIFAKYLCKLYTFEPHPVFYNNILQRFKHNKNVKVYNFGLSSAETKVQFSTEADATSQFIKGGQSEGIKEVDLMKINIEGGEYDLLEHLISTGWIKNIKQLQIQFHHFIPDAEKRMKSIQDALGSTHDTTYIYKFFWENWRRKKSV